MSKNDGFESKTDHKLNPAIRVVFNDFNWCYEINLI